MTPPEITANILKAWRGEIFEKENKLRAENHLNAMVMDGNLNRLAEQLVQKMAKKHDFVLEKLQSYDVDVLGWGGTPGVGSVFDWIKSSYLVS